MGYVRATLRRELCRPPIHRRCHSSHHFGIRPDRGRKSPTLRSSMQVPRSEFGLGSMISRAVSARTSKSI
jgi:hypothetical protein